MMLTNCTDSPRGIAFKKGLVILQGREMRQIPDSEQDEVRAMFKSRTFQRFVDNGIFRLSEMDADEESTEVKTPEPPADLKPAAPVEGLQAPVGTATGKLASEPKIVEHQAGGPLPGESTEVKTPEPPVQEAPAVKAATKVAPKAATKA